MTPIVFDHFPRDREGRRAAEILADSCTRIGLPVPTKVDLSGFSKFLGVPPVCDFRLRRRDTDPPRPATHAVLHFDRPIRGPVILGAGRFFGSGLCRPVKTKADEPDQSLPDQFSEFFAAVHGYPPFAWQTRMAAEVLSTGHWAENVSLPTSAGKTSLIDIAVFALACEAHLPPAERRTALRIFSLCL